MLTKAQADISADVGEAPASEIGPSRHLHLRVVQRHTLAVTAPEGQAAKGFIY